MDSCFGASVDLTPLHVGRLMYVVPWRSVNPPPYAAPTYGNRPHSLRRTEWPEPAATPPSCGFFYIFWRFTEVPEYRPCARFSTPLLRPEPSISGTWSSGLHNDPPEVPRVLHFPRSRKGTWHFRGIVVQNGARLTRSVLLPRVLSGFWVAVRSLVVELLELKKDRDENSGDE